MAKAKSLTKGKTKNATPFVGVSKAGEKKQQKRLVVPVDNHGGGVVAKVVVKKKAPAPAPAFKATFKKVK